MVCYAILAVQYDGMVEKVSNANVIIASERRVLCHLYTLTGHAGSGYFDETNPFLRLRH